MRRRAKRRLIVAAAIAALAFVARCSPYAGTSTNGTNGTSSTDASTPTDANTTSANDAIAPGDAGTYDANLTSTYAEAVLADGPIAYFRLDDPADTNLAVDAVGGLIGPWGSSVVHGAGLITGGDPGASFPTASTMQGTIANVISFERSPTLEPIKGLTIECWMRATTLGTAVNYQYLVSYGTSDVQPYQAWVFQLHGPNAEIYARGIGTGTGNTTLQTNTTYHLAVTYDGTAFALYVDGILDKTMPAAGPLSYDQTSGLGIGGSALGEATFNGSIDEVAIYDHALTAARLAAHFQAGTQ